MTVHRNLQRGLLVLLLVTTVFFAAAFSAQHAQAVTSSDTSCEADNIGKILPPCTKCGECEIVDFLKLFQNLYEFGLQLAVPLGIFFLIVGGIFLLTASGRSSQIESGKTIIRQSITGLVIILVSWIIVDTGVYLITGSNKGTIFNKSWYSFEYTCSDDDLTVGCSGKNVTTWQQILIKLGYSGVRSNGKYDPATVSAVRAFQTDAQELVTQDSAQSCEPRLWLAVFGKSCVLPPSPGQCLATADEVAAKKPAISGQLDAKTQSLLTILNGSDPESHVSYSATYQDYCLSP